MMASRSAKGGTKGNAGKSVVAPRRIAGGLAALTAIILAVAWLSGWFETKIAPGTLETAGARDVSQVTGVAVERVVEPAVEWASGTVESARRTTVAARIVTRIERIHVSAGDEVKRGDILVELDAREPQARVQQAQDALKAAKARRDLAIAELERSRELLARGVTTRQRHDQAISAERIASADVDRAGQALEEARAGLSHTVIRAPVAGRVIDRLAEPGDTVTPGAPLLRLYDPAALRVEAPVRESLAVNLSVGDTLKIEMSSLGETQSGPIDEIVPYADPGARTLLVKVALPDGSRAFAGMFARIGVPAGMRERLIIPQSAIRRIGQLEFAYVLEKDRVEQRLITTGEGLSGGRIDVLSGLSQGARVVSPWRDAVK
ncbi:Efflux pump periplasmic linker BepF [bacterium BMS3Bbin10]|nr:Efflux pump periplasmic linker BepF [bacterium BMS3Bbin10]HDL17310.1 efflux RND transporter periplasmic adaptor subunit [Hyphomicrobiales bacterium]